PGTNMRTYKTFAHIVGMILIRSFERAERVQQAMLCRGFSGRFPRSKDYSPGTVDLLFSAGTVLLLIAVICVEIRGHSL
ncbi:MAG: energy-coupling factor transporter transmembrane component T family protein, partial [Desulfonatronovibrionaceae bacterium]